MNWSKPIFDFGELEVRRSESYRDHLWVKFKLDGETFQHFANRTRKEGRREKGMANNGMQ